MTNYGERSKNQRRYMRKFVKAIDAYERYQSGLLRVGDSFRGVNVDRTSGFAGRVKRNNFPSPSRPPQPSGQNLEREFVELSELLAKDWDRDVSVLLRSRVPVTGNRVRKFILYWMSIFDRFMRVTSQIPSSASMKAYYDTLVQANYYLNKEFLDKKDSDITFMFRVAKNETVNLLLAIGENLRKVFKVENILKRDKLPLREPFFNSNEIAQILNARNHPYVRNGTLTPDQAAALAKKRVVDNSPPAVAPAAVPSPARIDASIQSLTKTMAATGGGSSPSPTTGTTSSASGSSSGSGSSSSDKPANSDSGKVAGVEIVGFTDRIKMSPDFYSFMTVASDAALAYVSAAQHFDALVEEKARLLPTDRIGSLNEVILSLGKIVKLVNEINEKIISVHSIFGNLQSPNAQKLKKDFSDLLDVPIVYAFEVDGKLEIVMTDIWKRVKNSDVFRKIAIYDSLSNGDNNQKQGGGNQPKRADSSLKYLGATTANQLRQDHRDVVINRLVSLHTGNSKLKSESDLIRKIQKSTDYNRVSGDEGKRLRNFYQENYENIVGRSLDIFFEYYERARDELLKEKDRNTHQRENTLLAFMNTIRDNINTELGKELGRLESLSYRIDSYFSGNDEVINAFVGVVPGWKSDTTVESYISYKKYEDRFNEIKLQIDDYYGKIGFFIDQQIAKFNKFFDVSVFIREGGALMLESLRTEINELVALGEDVTSRLRYLKTFFGGVSGQRKSFDEVFNTLASFSNIALDSVEIDESYQSNGVFKGDKGILDILKIVYGEVGANPYLNDFVASFLRVVGGRNKSHKFVINMMYEAFGIEPPVKSINVLQLKRLALKWAYRMYLEDMKR